MNPDLTPAAEIEAVRRRLDALERLVAAWPTPRTRPSRNGHDPAGGPGPTDRNGGTGGVPLAGHALAGREGDPSETFCDHFPISRKQPNEQA